MKLTVIIHDAKPIAFANEPCSHRRVTVQFTQEQGAALRLRDNYEGYSTFFIENEPEGLGCDPLTWERVTRRVGEEFACSGPAGYYYFGPAEWLDWMLARIHKQREANDIKEVPPV